MSADTPPTSNPRVRVTDVRLLSDNWYRLHTTTFDYLSDDGVWTSQSRETYDRGNGATILLYDHERRTVLLTSQFRYPVYVNGHPDGMLLETAAGLLDDDDPETAIRREAIEETGHEVGAVSYTHLDVYKRQARARPRASSCSPPAPRPRRPSLPALTRSAAPSSSTRWRPVTPRSTPPSPPLSSWARSVVSVRCSVRVASCRTRRPAP